ncbi:hypothetical protein [Deinococcus sp. RIT780]|uniref:hypothetical protein n=1 Tax=Deinococcus sp. RIT780 TaxID=2870472 RepID=UPI001C8A8ECF|nr:hypothetical protein [Deinococcus sp. RIT780]MBX8466025.1 hypothetical protein [Deinococcus sp. RIT780]
MRSTETTRFVPARSRSLLGLLTLGLLAGAPAFAQTTPPGAAPAETTPITVPATEPTPEQITEPTTEPVPNLGLPATGTEQATPPLPTDTAPTDAAPTETVPTETAPVETAPAPDDVAPTASSLPAPGSVKVPVLEGEEVLKTVPTVLGEALVYAGGTGDAMARTLAALQADGYTTVDGSDASAGSEVTGDAVLLSRDGQAFELSGRESFGVTVVALSRLPATAATDTAPTETAPDTAPADTETAPTQPDAPAEPDTDAPPATTDPAVTDPASTEPAVPAPAEPTPTEPTPAEPAPVTPGQP